MQLKSTQFIRTPLSLLRIPEYVRFFEGSSEGVVFKVLQSSIWRVKDSEGLRRTDWRYQLVKRYEKGILATFTTYEDLSERSGLGDRQVRRNIDRLVQLGLIQLEGFGSSGIIVRLGDRNELFLERMAKQSRAYIIARLFKAELINGRDRRNVLLRIEEDFGEEAVENIENLSKKLAEFPAWISPRNQSKTNRRKGAKLRQQGPIFMTTDVGSYSIPTFPDPVMLSARKTKKKVDNQQHDSVTTLSKPNADNPVQDGVTPPLLIENRIENKNLDWEPPRFGSPNGQKKGAPQAPNLFDDLTDSEDLPISQTLLIRIESETTWTGAERAAREALGKGVPLNQINQALSKRVPEEVRRRYPALPRFANRVYWLEKAPKDRRETHIELSLLWRSLVEDVTGVNHADNSKFYTEVRGAYKRSVNKFFSWRQIMWTLNRVVNSSSDLKFLVTGGRNMITLLKQHGAAFQEVNTEYHRRLQEEEQRKRMEAQKQREVEELRNDGGGTPQQKRMMEGFYRRIEEKRKFEEEQRRIKEERWKKNDAAARKNYPDDWLEKRLAQMREDK